MSSISRLAVLLMAGVLSTIGKVNAQTACGCKLLQVAYDGFFLGLQSVPNVAITFTPGIGTHNGSCLGTNPACTVSTVCNYADGSFHITNNNGGGGPTISVYDIPHGDVPRASLAPGDAASFEVKRVPTVNIECGDNYDVLDLEFSGDTWTVAVRCTSCPENNGI